MTKRSTLSQALKQASGKADPKPAVPPPAETQLHRTPGRRGQKNIAGYFDPAASKQLHQIALDEDTTVQELLREAINDLFEKRGKARIA
jgi:hypothetical protein